MNSADTLRVWVSTHPDDNIFHIFALEVHGLWSAMRRDPHRRHAIVLPDDDDERPGRRWRRAVMAALAPVYRDAGELPDGPRRLTQHRFEDWIVDPWRFRNDPVSGALKALEARLRLAFGVSGHAGSEVVMIARTADRVLHDAVTGEPLETTIAAWCAARGLPFRCVRPETLPVAAQVEAMSRARVLIACHGAGLTNLVFAPDDCAIVEVSFRTHWYCDPVCDDHFHGRLSPQTKCGGRLTFARKFHKADYHNLARISGRRHVELPLHRVEGYLGRNPIAVRRVDVDPHRLREALDRALA
ncbi:MAG: glycosyltransferase 61 family protein [Reyranellaceae bacterium]